MGNGGAPSLGHSLALPAVRETRAMKPVHPSHARGRNVALAGAAVTFVACAVQPGPQDNSGTLDDGLSSCSVKVTTNGYDGPSYWGTLSFTSASALSAPSISFQVPAGVTCTQDYNPTGFTHTQSGTTCTFKASSGVKVAANTVYTIHYSTDSDQ